MNINLEPRGGGWRATTTKSGQPSLLIRANGVVHSTPESFIRDRNAQDIYDRAVFQLKSDFNFIPPTPRSSTCYS